MTAVLLFQCKFQHSCQKQELSAIIKTGFPPSKLKYIKKSKQKKSQENVKNPSSKEGF